MNKKNVAIVGVTGYTGMELVRILTNHPGFEISAVT
ncbi:MAG: N-acetyl-gamma-glutamyl-phosphate reductase, partial [Desulfonatronovibrio sp. MSAO_Bac4]